MKTFSHGDVIEIKGNLRHAFQSVGTLRGFAATCGWIKDVEADRAASLARGEKDVWLNALPNVIAADGLSMRERERPVATVEVGELVSIEGATYRVRTPDPRRLEGDSAQLDPVTE